MTGRNNKPTFREIYTSEQIRNVAEFIVQGWARPAR